ncbi:MAG: nucleotide disphospho-sugar-binding domain-containing protein [Ruminiclostridium sp.]
MLSKKAKSQMGIQGKNLISAVLYDMAELNIVYVTQSFQPYADTFDKRFVFTIPGIENTRKIDIEIPYEKMKAPIIYISLGSMISRKSFLKKCVKAFGNKDMTVILSCGGLQPEKLGKLPENIYAYSFVPQLEVLQHVDLFFTHGGMNSVNEAMFYGVPMLVKPVINDQPVNAFQVEELQIGKQMTHPYSAKNIHMKTMDVLNDASIKINAEEFNKKVRADLGVSGVADKVEKVLQQYGHNR